MTKQQKRMSVHLADLIGLIRRFLRERMNEHLSLKFVEELVENNPMKMVLLLLIAGFLCHPETAGKKVWKELSRKFFEKYLPEILDYLTRSEGTVHGLIPVKDIPELLRRIISLQEDEIVWEFTPRRLNRLVYSHFDTGYTLPELTQKINNILDY